MVGLLSCAVPTGLKAEILNAISALSKTPEIAFSIWQNIEAAQLINTIPTTSQQRPLGIIFTHCAAVLEIKRKKNMMSCPSIR